MVRAVIDNIGSNQDEIEDMKAKFWNDFGAYKEHQSIYD